MSKLIDKLTKEQSDKIPEYLERFKSIGLSTAPVDKEKAEDAIRRSYEYMSRSNSSFSKNPEFVWADSPFEGRKLAAQFAKGSLDVTEEEIKEQAELASYGSFESYWVAMYAFIAEQLPVQKDELIDIVIDIVTHCGVYWTFDKLVVLTPKPVKISMEKEVLHSEDGGALVYPNGDAVYAYKGEIKKSLIEVLLAKKAGDAKTA